MKKNTLLLSRIVGVFALIIFFIFQTLHFDFPLLTIEGDDTKDYTLANHIITYHDFPLLGPYNGGTHDELRASPIYYYLLAGILTIYNSPFSILFVLLLLQIGGLIALYLLTEDILSPPLASLITVLYAFHPTFLTSSIRIWNPVFMLPFLSISFYFLYKGYCSKSRNYLLASSFFLVFAIMLHNSAIIFLPLFLFGLIHTQVSQKEKFHILVSGIAFSFLFMLPVIVFYIKSPHLLSFSKLSTSIFLPFSTQSFLASGMSFFNRLGIIQPYLLTFLGISLVGYFWQEKVSYRKWSVLLILELLFLQVVIISLLSNPHEFYFDTFLWPILGSIVLCLYTLFSRFKFGNIYFLVSIICVSASLFSSFPQRTSSFGKTTTQLSDAVRHTAVQLAQIKTAHHYTDYSFFYLYSAYPHLQYVSQIPMTNYIISDAVFLSPLEHILRTKLVQPDTGLYRLHQISSAQTATHIVFVCYAGQTAQQACLSTFTKNHHLSSPFEKIYANSLLTVYLQKEK
jgi:hypothetical protein